MPDRDESFREINSSKDRSRSRPGFVKLIPNNRKKEQNMIYSRPSKTEIGLLGREKME